MELKPKLTRQHTYKCVLIGDTGTGKSTFLRRHATGAFEPRHLATNGVCVHTLKLQTNYQEVALEIWDTSGDARLGGLRNAYYLYAKCAIVMYDLASAASGVSVPRWLQQLDEICGPLTPVVVCGNKAELERVPGNFRYRRRGNFDYCELSTRAAWNLDAPFELLCKQLLRRPGLRLIAQPLLRPAEDFVWDAAQEWRMWEQLKAMHSNALPEKAGSDADLKLSAEEVKMDKADEQCIILN